MRPPERVVAAVRARADAPTADALPAYLHDLDGLDAHARTVRAALGGTRLLYAVKANPDPGMLGVLARHVDGFEVASAGELAHVRTHVPGARVAFGGPGKTDAELAAAVAARVHRVHVESLDELRRLDAAARAAGWRAPVLLRVNPAADAPSGVLRMGGPSPFGMDPGHARACLDALPALPGVAFAGVHGHLGSGLDAAACAAQAAVVLGCARELAGAALAEVNVGGGMAVDYRDPDARFDWAAYGAALPAGTPLTVEPGRALTAYAGWYATRVLELKRSHGAWFAICLGGTHHLRTPAAKGHDQPLAVLPVAGWDRPWERPGTDERVTFVGQLCTPKDVLARDVAAGRVRTGDLVVFGMAGAYALNISHQDFLLHPRPAVAQVGAPTADAPTH